MPSSDPTGEASPPAPACHLGPLLPQESPRGAFVFSVLAIHSYPDSDRCRQRLEHRPEGARVQREDAETQMPGAIKSHPGTEDERPGHEWWYIISPSATVIREDGALGPYSR